MKVSEYNNWYAVHFADHIVFDWELPYLTVFEQSELNGTPVTREWRDQEGRLHLDVYEK